CGQIGPGQSMSVIAVSSHWLLHGTCLLLTEANLRQCNFQRKSKRTLVTATCSASPRRADLLSCSSPTAGSTFLLAICHRTRANSALSALLDALLKIT